MTATNARQTEVAPGRRLYSGRLVRTSDGRCAAFTDVVIAEAPQVVSIERPARAALFLALAHRWVAEIAAGVYKDRADVARKLGITRARVSQIMDLLLLAPDIQEAVLFVMRSGGREPVTERQLRRLAKIADWREQRREWAARSERIAADQFVNEAANSV